MTEKLGFDSAASASQMTTRTPIFAVLPADQAYAHEGGKKRFNEAITRLTATGDRWELHDAPVSLTDEALWTKLTGERFGNLVAFRIGRSPKRFWCWEGAIR
jgi:hypothetical protein